MAAATATGARAATEAPTISVAPGRHGRERRAQSSAEAPSALIATYGSRSWPTDSSLSLTVTDSRRMASVPRGLLSGSRFSAVGLAALGAGPSGVPDPLHALDVQPARRQRLSATWSFRQPRIPMRAPGWTERTGGHSAERHRQPPELLITQLDSRSLFLLAHMANAGDPLPRRRADCGGPATLDIHTARSRRASIELLPLLL